MNELPHGTVTFLFTDIEGSTKLWQEFPAAMTIALAQHHEILRHAIETHNGYVFQIIGDAFCAAFETALDGLDASLAAQRALRDFEWGKTDAIRVRMALHTGTVQVRIGEITSGEYVSGITLSRAARLLSAGHGGQILLSEPTAALVREQLVQDLALRDLGAHRLKDLLQPQQIYQIVVADLPQEFPLKTLDALPNNLPLQMTSFIGREREAKEIQQLLIGDRGQGSGSRFASPSPRLVTLTGSGGSGKTRLSLQVAADVIDDFEKGIWFVDLSPIADPSLVPNAVIKALELREEAGRAPLDALTDFLHAKNLLLVLDNCEHLIEACAELAHHLLTHCPNLKILATSREALGIAGEQIYQVPALALPGPHSLTPDSLTQYDAVKLFIERAMSIQPNFAVTNANAPAIALICSRLDGIPLALELAAARIRLFSPEQIAARLDDRLRLLTGGSRTVMPRQQTLRAAIEWSYSLLSEQERILFRRLAVFAGGWTFDAAEQVCAGDALDAPDVLELLAQLVNKSLVTTEARGEETRYRMLETIREYALTKLDESGERETLRAGHLSFLLAMAERADSEHTGHCQVDWLNRVEWERDNLRAALEWAIATDQTKATLQLAGNLSWFWFMRSHFNEARRWFGRALDLRDAPLYPHWYASVLAKAANHAWLQGDFNKARELAEEALSIARAQVDKPNITLALHQLGLVYALDNHLAQAHSALEESKLVCREIHDEWGYLQCLLGLGLVAEIEDDGATSLALHKQVASGCRERGDTFFQGIALRWVGKRLVQQGDMMGGLAALRDSLTLARGIGSKYEVALALGELGKTVQQSGNPERAIQMYCAAKNLFESVGAWTNKDDPEFENMLAECRAELEESAFTKAVEHGRALTMEQAVELALSA